MNWSVTYTLVDTKLVWICKYYDEAEEFISDMAQLGGKDFTIGDVPEDDSSWGEQYTWDD